MCPVLIRGREREARYEMTEGGKRCEMEKMNVFYSDLMVSAHTVHGKSRFGGDAALELIGKPSDITVDMDGLTFPSHDLLK